MDAYIFCADIYCRDCAEKLKVDLAGNPVSECGTCDDFARCKDLGLCLLGEVSEDSEVWPQGPYPNGGGEADAPQHCGDCHDFLQNPLTGDGYAYVAEQLDGSGNPTVIAEWLDFYKGENPVLDKAIENFIAAFERGEASPAMQRLAAELIETGVME